MSKIHKKKVRSSLFKNGEHGHHNTLSREFKGIDTGGWLVKSFRGLIDRRDYESDRNKGIRRIMNKKRRISMKRNVQKELNNELE